MQTRFFFLLRFILSRGAISKDINDKCILYNNCDNSQEHVVNDCAGTEKLRTKLTKEFNDLDNSTKIKNKDFYSNVSFKLCCVSFIVLNNFNILIKH